MSAEITTPKRLSENFHLDLPGYEWLGNGQSAFSGELWKLYQKLDTLFLGLAAEVGALEHQFPTFIAARELKKLEYFKSFPHLITFPVTLGADEENIRAFASNPDSVTENGQVTLTQASPICDCLTPAACYHFYIHYQGKKLSQPLYLTTRATCYRRETHYVPLQRQWGFGMREIVCLGTSDEVRGFLERYRAKVNAIFESWGFPVSWDVATDPFFDPTRNPKYLMQIADPVKTEMIYDGKLSIGSVNFHRSYFGEAFKIERGGAEASSGCVAFGMERWIYALLNERGTNPENWPEELRPRAQASRSGT